MSILIFAIVVLIVIALAVLAIDYLPLPSPFGRIIQALVIGIGALVIANRAGIV